MNIKKEEIENFVIAHANNVFQRYYWKCGNCLKVSDSVLNISKIQDSFIRHRKRVHPRMRVNPEYVQHNYPDIGYLNSKEQYILWLSLLCSKRYTKSIDEKEVYNLCSQYVKDVMNMKERNERA